APLGALQPAARSARTAPRAVGRSARPVHRGAARTDAETALRNGNAIWSGRVARGHRTGRRPAPGQSGAAGHLDAATRLRQAIAGCRAVGQAMAPAEGPGGNPPG